MIRPRDWILLAIDAASKRCLAPVQLQKSIFLLSRNLTPQQLRTSQFYEFDPYDYGPFSSAVYTDAEKLEQEGLIEIQRPPATRYKLFVISDQGHLRALDLRAELDEPVLSYLDRVVAWTGGLGFNQLVSAIYSAYPEMRVNSVFQK